ncbi:MAG: cobalamin biosynthesis protein, partial [Dolichospermum sp.]
MISAFVLILAALLDYLIGDPWGWPHPVRVIGWVISRFTNISFKYCQNPFSQRLAGIILGIGVIFSSGWLGWMIVKIAQGVHPFLGITVQSILL